MSFCSKCGIQLEEKVKFCPGCGSEILSNSEETSKNSSSNIDQMVGDLTDTPDTTSEFDFNDILDTKYFCIFSYLGILFLIPLLLKRDSKFSKFHVNQGLILLISSIVLTTVTSIIASLPIIGVIGGILSLIVSASIVLLMVLGVVNAAQGKAKELPVIGKYKILK